MARRAKLKCPESRAPKNRQEWEDWDQRRYISQAEPEFRKRVSDLSPRERAEAWLSVVVEQSEDQTGWGVTDFTGYEAHVYLATRGKLTAHHRKIIESNFRFAINEELDIAHQYRGGDLDPRRMSPDTASSFILGNFWDPGSTPEAGDSLPATMFRVASTCNIKGFDSWWNRFAKETRVDLITGGFDGFPAAFHCFNFVRSDFARQVLGNTLTLMFEAAMLPQRYDEMPWDHIRAGQSPTQYVECGQCACLAFVAELLNAECWSSKLAERAWDDLQSEMHEASYWTTCDTFEGRSVASICSTAIVLHALSIGKPPGWQDIADPAVSWLWTQQSPLGCWVEVGTPGPAWLTVLVLDAIDLVQGKLPVTFSTQTPATAADTIPMWDGTRLLFAGREVIRLSQRATNQITILDAFQQNDWAPRIEDPFDEDLGAKRRDAINDLNNKIKSETQSPPLIFSSDGANSGICWASA